MMISNYRALVVWLTVINWKKSSLKPSSSNGAKKPKYICRSGGKREVFGISAVSHSTQ